MNKEMIEYLRYKKSQRKDDCYYDTDNMSDYNGETWLKPLLSHPELIEELGKINFNDHVKSNYVKLQNTKFKNATIKYHPEVGPILVATLDSTYTNGRRDSILTIGETSHISLLGRYANGDSLLDWFYSEFDEPYSMSNCIASVLSQLNKGRIIDGKSYDEVILERKQMAIYSKYKVKCEELDEQKRKLQLESQKKIESMPHTIIEDNEDIVKRYPNLSTPHTM